MEVKTVQDTLKAGGCGERHKYTTAKIGVLMGGPSSEREISLKSGRAVFESLKKQRLDVVAVDIPSDDPAETKEILRRNGIECAVIALHGKFGEDGTVQAVLDELGIPYSGSGVRASSQAMDKTAAKKLFVAGGLACPRHFVLEKTTPAGQAIACDFDLPWVVKPVSGGSSIGLSLVEHRDDLTRALEEGFAYDDRLIIEEYIRGRELTVAILGKKPLSVIEIVPKTRFFDYRAKYEKGMTEYIVPARLDPEIEQDVKAAALRAHTLLGCSGASRVDIMLSENDTAYVLEVNTIPGLTATSLLPKAAGHEGIDFDHLCLKLLESAYEKE